MLVEYVSSCPNQRRPQAMQRTHEFGVHGEESRPRADVCSGKAGSAVAERESRREVARHIPLIERSAGCHGVDARNGVLESIGLDVRRILDSEAWSVQERHDKLEVGAIGFMLLLLP